MTSTTSYVKGRGEGWGDRQAVVGPSGCHGAHRRSARVMVHVGLHWLRVVVGAAHRYRGCCWVLGAIHRCCRWWWGLIVVHQWWQWALVDGRGGSSPFVEGGVEAHCGLGRMLLPSSPFVEGCFGTGCCSSRVIVGVG